MTHDDNDLVRGFRAGEAGSFETLYREYGVRIYRFCLRLCGNEADAEDLTQEVFLAAYKGLDRFTGRSSLATWLYRIALYRRRSTSGMRMPRTVPLHECRLPPTSDPAQAGMDRMALESALSMLPENLRTAFLLVKEEGLLCREAAEALGIPEGTLKSRVYAAVVRLQRLLETEESTTPQKQSAGVTQTREMTNEL